MIPDFQSLMLPLLRQLSDGKEHSYRQLIEALTKEFNLTDAERREMLASGAQEVFSNRASWATTYLKKAGLIASPKRSTFVITGEGTKVLRTNPEKINTAYLRKYETFLEFQNINNTEKKEEQNDKLLNDTAQSTPEEALGAAYSSIRSALASELLEKILKLSPQFFEKMVIDLLVAMGYGGSISDAGRAVGKSGDEGIDGIIKEDRLGLDIIYIQAKRWKEGTVGRPEIQKFVGALAGQGAKKGIFITTSRFSKDAEDYNPKNETKIVLIDGEKLAQLMIDYSIGCSVQRTFEIKKIDNDYFEEE